jgi:alkylation response protein AidB-like acyl-CoA dehydrogenase
MTLIETQPETEHIARTRAIIPALRARADEAAALRRVPAENIDLLREAGSFKTIQSRRNGGFGFGMRTHVEVIASLAEGCAATAWVAGVTQAHSWMLSHFPTAAQDDAYANPDNVVSAVIGPRGVAVKTADGFRLSGFWPFASGNENSQWLILGGVVKDE